MAGPLQRVKPRTGIEFYVLKKRLIEVQKNRCSPKAKNIYVYKAKKSNLNGNLSKKHICVYGCFRK